jgi:sigma-54 dependent transcriptional regulator, acetoin dehydrogenase operon transcriptional activator AcoR
MSPYLSLYSTSNLSQKVKELEYLWESFVQNHEPPTNLRSSVYESWKRCQMYGVDPKKTKTDVSLSDDHLRELISQSRLYEAAIPIMDDLTRQIRGTNYLTTLCDREGRIIYLDGDHKILSVAELMNFLVGADWSEQAAGTNAIGTSLATGHPIQILSAEHYCQGCHPWICSSAPIKDPLTGQILGAIDLTGLSIEAQPHTLEIAIMAAGFVQRQFENISYSTLQYLHHHFSEVVKRKKQEALILFDVSLNLLDGTERALKLLNIRDWRQIKSIPQVKALQHILLHEIHTGKEFFLDQLNLSIYIEEINIQFERVGFLVHLIPERAQHVVNPNRYTPSHHPEWSIVIGQSAQIQAAVRKAQLIAPTQVSVLITGESGTGKELIARTLHETSLRRRSPFLAINCGSIPKELIGSELFGYEPGTFTGGNAKGKKGKFEEATGGTLFLDEVGEMPLDLQVHLLRVLQEKEVVRLGAVKPIPVDVRIIAATHQNIPQLIQEGKFRADLYYRLNVVELFIPPLHERGDDIFLLVDHFLQRLCHKYNKQKISIDQEVITLFKTYDWPGNIRELENAMEHAVLFCMTDRISLLDLPRTLLERANRKDGLVITTEKSDLEEREMVIRYIAETNGNLSEVARRLNMARTTLYRKMAKYGISKVFH